MVKAFRTKPFPLFDSIGDLVDGTRATGEGVFIAGRTSAFDRHDSPLHGDSPISVHSQNDDNIDPSLREISCNVDKGKGKASGSNTQVSAYQAMSVSLIYTATHLQIKKAGASFYGSDDYSSSDDDLPSPIASPSPPPAKRKRTKSAGPSTNNTSKLRRLTAGQGMSKVAGSLSDIAKAVKKRKAAKALAGLTQGPLERAIAILETDAAFNDDTMPKIIELFMANRDIATVYATLQSFHGRTNLVQYHLAKLEGGAA